MLAQEEAHSLRHNYIGTEHLLLGLLREQEGIAARVLASLDVSYDGVRAQVARIVGEGHAVTSGQVPFTPRTKRTLENALREAVAMRHDHIGTEHLLLALANVDDGVSAQILADQGIDGGTLRAGVFGVLAPGQPVPPPPRASRVSRRGGPLVPVLVGSALVSGAIGLLVGWLIWG